MEDLAGYVVMDEVVDKAINGDSSGAFSPVQSSAVTLKQSSMGKCHAYYRRLQSDRNI